MMLLRNSVSRLLVVFAAWSLVAISVGLQVGPAQALAQGTGGPAVTGSNCVGSSDTVSWSPVPGALSYRIVENWANLYGQPQSLTLDVPVSQTSVQVPVEFGQVFISLFYGQPQPPFPNPPVPPFVQFGSLSYYGFQTPAPIQWDSNHFQWSFAGNGSVTIAFYYYAAGGTVLSGGISGGVSTDTITVTASPGGKTMSSTLQLINGGLDGFGVTDTFTGLTNGIPYTFTATASNSCGTSGPSANSPLYTPRAPGGLYCVVTRVQFPPAVPSAQQTVQALAADGLASISNIQIANGTVSAPTFPVGLTDPVNVVATKTDPSKRTVWGFDMTDVNGKTQHCT